MVLPFKGAQKHLQKGVCQNWTFTRREGISLKMPVSCITAWAFSYILLSGYAKHL